MFFVLCAGREPDAKVIKEMLAECPEKLNFTHFLTLFGEKLHGKYRRNFLLNIPFIDGA